ncbi:hypothetical protein TI03_01955 [Achromatium sp. WMS1]|nr:hypothetical protein TI03_01955 [Achromatium sp. WMS1]
MNTNRHRPKDPFIAAYQIMLEYIHAAIGQPGNRMLALRADLELAREKALELSELTREEIEHVATYLERDLHDAAIFIADTGKELKQWWQFDVQQVEENLLNMFSNVADQASLQLHAFNEQLQRLKIYQAGEVTGPGTLICCNCACEQHFAVLGIIKPCAKCSNHKFQRICS